MVLLLSDLTKRNKGPVSFAVSSTSVSLETRFVSLFVSCICNSDEFVTAGSSFSCVVVRIFSYIGFRLVLGFLPLVLVKIGPSDMDLVPLRKLFRGE